MHLQREERQMNLRETRYQTELALLKVQEVWISRIYSLFSGSLGLMAGMSIMHMVLLAFVGRRDNFYEIYSPMSMTLNLIFLIVSNFVVVFALTQTLIFRQKSLEQMRNMSEGKAALVMNYTIFIVISALALITLICQLTLPKYTNQLYYK